MSEAQLRIAVRKILKESLITEKKSKVAKNWKEYVSQTVEKYEGLSDAGKPIDEEYVSGFVEKYRNIIKKYKVFSDISQKEDNEVAQKAVKIFSDMMKFEPEMDDSFGAFQKWYMAFNDSELGKTYRDTDTFSENPKYLSAVAIMDMINSTNFVFDDLMNPKKIEQMELPPKIKEEPPEKQAKAVEKAEEKIKDQFKNQIMKGLKAFGSKFKKEDGEDGGKKKGKYNPTKLPKEIPQDHPAYIAMDSDGDGRIGQREISAWMSGGMAKYLDKHGVTKFETQESGGKKPKDKSKRVVGKSKKARKMKKAKKG